MTSFHEGDDGPEETALKIRDTWQNVYGLVNHLVFDGMSKAVFRKEFMKAAREKNELD